MHFTRFRVDRLLQSADLSTAELRDEALSRIAPVIAELPDGALREELTAQVSDRMQLGPAIVDRIVRAAPRPQAPQQQGGRPGAPQSGPPGGAPAQSYAPQGAQAQPQRRLPQRLDPFDEQERTLLAMMLALGEQGRAHLAELDLADLRVPHVQAVAAWLQQGGDAGGQLPADDVLSEVARDVLLRSGALEVRPAALEVELAQLAIRRLERQVGEARRQGQPVDDLNRSILTARERLDAAMLAALDG